METTGWLILVALLLATPAGGVEGPAGSKGDVFPRTDFNDWVGPTIKLWTDPQTGCEYLYGEGAHQGGLSIRMDRCGIPMCPHAPPCVTGAANDQ